MSKAKEEYYKLVEEIESLAWDIRSDWSDPRSDCKEIISLCGKINLKIKELEEQNKSLIHDIDLANDTIIELQEHIKLITGS